MGTLAEDLETGADWAAQALWSAGCQGDLSPTSVREVERFLGEHADAGLPRPGGRLEDRTQARLFALGAYVGEVLRLSLGGEWLTQDVAEGHDEQVPLLLADGQLTYPLARVLARYADPAESLVTYALSLGLRL